MVADYTFGSGKPFYNEQQETIITKEGANQFYYPAKAGDYYVANYNP